MSDQSILLEKRKTFLSSSRSSPELLINNNFVDLSYFFEYDDLINFVENKHLTQLVINRNEFLHNFKAKLNSCIEIKDFISESSNYNLQINLINQNLLLKDLEVNKPKIIKQLCEKLESNLDHFLFYNRVAKSKFYDSSTWCLYFCFGTLEGKIAAYDNEVLIRAPLINIEVQINLDPNSNIVISKRSEDAVANEILEINLDTDLSCKTQLSALIDVEQLSVSSYFNSISHNIRNTIVAPYPIKMNKEYKNTEIDTNFAINKTCFLALYNPLGGKMLNDYDEILKNNYLFPVVDTLFNQNENDDIYQNDNIFEINRPSNLVQKLAIINSLKNNLLIYGPPGTGKSEVVTNIIANVVSKIKNVLVVSEKKAALDVLEERLGFLNSITLFAFDENFKDTFYNKILRLNELILQSKPIKLDLENTKFIKIKEYFALLNSLLDFRDYQGLDLEQMLKIYGRVDLQLFKTHLQTIKYISLKINQQISIETIIDEMNAYKNLTLAWAEVFDKVFIPEFIFDSEKLNSFSVLFEKASEKNKKHIINNFIENGVVRKNFSLSKIELKYEEKIPNLIQLLNKIKDENVEFLENFKELNNFFNEVNNANDYLTYYDWYKNTEITKFLNNIESSNDINTLINDYWSCKKHAAENFSSLIRDQYIYNLKKIILSSREFESQWVELVRKANLTKKHNLIKVIKEHYDILKFAFPIWILSPDKAVTIIPLKPGEFDYGIFDEASQMKFERGVPLVYRCSKIVVSGDDKQLKPTSFFSKNITLDEEYDGHLDNVDSLLDKAKTSNWMNFTLSNHYRSTTEELIYFPNKYIYNKQLFCITKNGSFDKSVEVYNVNGVYDRAGENINPVEAEKVLELILDNYKKYQTIIIVTFNQKQCDYIENLIYKEICLLDYLENLKIKVRSIENVQGDEADLIIISATFGKDKLGVFYQNFGPIGQDGGKNRLNVMITRARDKIMLVKSFSASDISTTENENTLLFKNFVNYAENLQSNAGLININENSQSILPQDELSELIVSELNNSNLPYCKIEINKKIGSHTINIAISKNSSSFFGVCILIDNYNKLRLNRNHDSSWIDIIDKQKYLEDRGYKTLRVNPLEWYLNTKQIMTKILSLVEKINVQ